MYSIAGLVVIREVKKFFFIFQEKQLLLIRNQHVDHTVQIIEKSQQIKH